MNSCYLWNFLLVSLMGGIALMRIFSHNSLSAYKDRNPKVDLKSFFNGDLEGWGGLFDHSGSQIRSFSLRLKGTWINDKEGTLEEWFEFDDGKKTERKWDVTFIDDAIFVGKAADVIGQAHGAQMGNAVNTHYTLRVPFKGGTKDFVMDDWMYQITPGVILNRVKMKKFGFPVGELVLMMKKI